ncbi:hypothetical protein GLV94_19725, partial [Virgibacillus halodenitrificans]|nr:hypothetical protein [Virgibacillus halodenitrificans]
MRKIVQLLIVLLLVNLVIPYSAFGEENIELENIPDKEIKQSITNNTTAEELSGEKSERSDSQSTNEEVDKNTQDKEEEPSLENESNKSGNNTFEKNSEVNDSNGTTDSNINNTETKVQNEQEISTKSTLPSETSTSKLGRINSANAQIFKVLTEPSTAIKAGTKYTNKVFYIKKQAKKAGELYYLI